MNYEVKGDVAVVRINDPNSKVLHALEGEAISLSLTIYSRRRVEVNCILDSLSGQYPISPNAEGDDRSYG